MKFKQWIESDNNQILFYNRDRERYGFLSNFHPAPFELDGEVWPTVEHYYMAMKSEDPAYRQQIMAAPTPGKAKRLGDSKENPAKQSLFRTGIALNPNWNTEKLKVMQRAVAAKFSQNPQLKQALLQTGNAELIEDSPTDSFWGIGNGSGQNWLGKILMDVRHKIG